MSTKTKARISIGTQKYKNVADPLASWGTLRRDIGSLTVAKLQALLKCEMSSSAPRAVILRALTGRINALKRGDGSRGPRAYHEKIRAAVGLPSRSVRYASEGGENALRAKAASRSKAKE